jgi:hypothetical protein
VGIVWDISGSMKDENTLRVKYAINYLLRSLSPKDECFMIAFNQNIFPIALDTDKSYVQQEDELMKKTKGEATFFL